MVRENIIGQSNPELVPVGQCFVFDVNSAFKSHYIPLLPQTIQKFFKPASEDYCIWPAKTGRLVFIKW